MNDMAKMTCDAPKSIRRQVFVLGLVTLLAFTAASIASNAADGPPVTGLIVGILAAVITCAVGTFVFYSRQSALSNVRTIMHFTMIVVGGVEVVGYCLWAVFAGSFGGGGVKLQGGITWASWILLFLLVGPMTLLVASVLAIWRPRCAGIWLVIASVASAVLAVLVMTPTPDSWSPGGDTLWFYAFKWSLTLIIPFSLPMFVFGLWLMVSRPTNRSIEEAIGSRV